LWLGQNLFVSHPPRSAVFNFLFIEFVRRKPPHPQVGTKTTANLAGACAGEQRRKHTI
jgi:hypothetical protein